MKSDLIWGWVFVGLALVMIACIIYGCCIGNWTAVPMCSFALTLNVCNAISRFKDYRRKRAWDSLSLMSMRRWRYYDADLDDDEDEPDDDNRITD